MDDDGFDDDGMDYDDLDEDVIVEDWLWDEDAVEESSEEPLTQSELALRKRMIAIFVGSLIGGIALIILIAGALKGLNPSSANKPPDPCLSGKVSECPVTKKPTSFTLPGGGKISDIKIDVPKVGDKKLLERCLNGNAAACSSSNSGR